MQEKEKGFVCSCKGKERVVAGEDVGKEKREFPDSYFDKILRHAVKKPTESSVKFTLFNDVLFL